MLSHRLVYQFLPNASLKVKDPKNCSHFWVTSEMLQSNFVIMILISMTSRGKDMWEFFLIPIDNVHRRKHFILRYQDVQCSRLGLLGPTHDNAYHILRELQQAYALRNIADIRMHRLPITAPGLAQATRQPVARLGQAIFATPISRNQKFQSARVAGKQNLRVFRVPYCIPVQQRDHLPDQVLQMTTCQVLRVDAPKLVTWKFARALTLGNDDLAWLAEES